MEIKEKLIDWINKTGYPLEIYTESELDKFDFRVTSSEIYQDLENKIFRELDLFATRSWDINDYSINLDIHLLIECKKSEKPFILLQNKSNKHENLSLGEIYGSDDSISLIFLTGSPKVIETPNKFETGFKLIQGFSTSDETIHKAVNTLLKSFNHFIIKEKEYENDYYKKENVHSIGIPVLIVDAPLFAMQMNEESEIEIKEIKTAILKQRSHLSRFENDSFPIPILTKDKISEIINSVEKFGDSFFQYLVSNPKFNINNLHNLRIVEKTMPNKL